MATTYTLISSNVLSSSAASVTFSSIPATYTDLVLRASVRTNNASTGDYFIPTINGSTSAIYSNTVLYYDNGGNPSSANEANVDPTTANYNVNVDAANNTANTFASLEFYFPSYTASQNRPYSQFGVKENNTGIGTEAKIYAVASLFRSTTVISSLSFAPLPSKSFVSGSSFYLYGISNA